MYKAFKMKLYPGCEAEYERRHNELWPEMKETIHAHGGKNYSIFLDRETLTLFGCIEIENEELWAKGADTAVNRKWWIIWRILWRQTLTTALFQWMRNLCSIWTDRGRSYYASGVQKRLSSARYERINKVTVKGLSSYNSGNHKVNGD